MRTTARSLPRLLLLLSAMSSAALAQFTFTSFDVPGASSTTSAAINNNGDVAGSYTLGSPAVTGGFIRKADGTFTLFDLSSANAKLFSLTAINDLGEVAGTATLNGAFGAAAAVGFVRDATGNVTTFSGSTGSGVDHISGLTNTGESVVQVSSGTGAKQFFLRTAVDGRIPIPAPASTTAFTPFGGFNNSGEAAGSWQLPDRIHTDGFVLDLSSQQFTLFNFSTGSRQGQTGDGTTATSINDSGQVLGCYNNGTEQTGLGILPDTGGIFQCVGYIRNTDGSLLESFALPFKTAQALGINQAREITGVYTDASGVKHAFVGLPSTSTAKPTITLIGIIPGPPQQAIFSVVDPVAGISNIFSIQSNATITIDPFTPGQTTPITVTATKTDQSLKAIIGIQASNTVGNFTDFDPAFVTVHAKESAASSALTDVPSSEHVLMVVNGDPGLSKLTVHVNGRNVLLPLQPNEKRTLNLGAWMKLDSNTVTFTGAGPDGAQASIALKDGSAAQTQGTGRF